MRTRTAASRGGSGNRGRRRDRSRNRYVAGDWNILSDYSGQKIKASEAMFTWDGLLVGKTEWEPKQPQLDIRGRDEEIAVPYARPRQPDTFSSTEADDL